VGPAAPGNMPGQFQAVATALAASVLAGPAPIGALLALLPEMADTLLMHDDWPPALAIFDREGHLRVPTPGWTSITVVVDQ
jgi:hypothetical protein